MNTKKDIDRKVKNLAKQKESRIERALVDLVLSYGGVCKKLQGAGNKADPDRLCLFPGGKVWFVETKRPGRKPDTAQIFTHTKLMKMGFKVSVIWDAEQLKQFENEISTCI